jgi:hypothetical protein
LFPESGGNVSVGVDNFPASIYFTHIMKCGGSTLDRLLSIASDERSVQYTSTEDPALPSPSRFNDGALKIVVVREPSDRVISHYWQLRPHSRHRGGSNKICKRIAMKSFRHFLEQCRMYSSNFMVEYHGNSIVKNLDQFSLVIPYEYYNEGLLMLHLFAGFSVKNILYSSYKNGSRRFKR